MAILAGDIRLLASQVMDDVPNGGGQPSAVVIADGVSNSIFQDVSELDRTTGRVSLRKVYPHVNTPTTDTFLGSNIIIGTPPADQNVTCTLFTTDSGFDTRADAQGRLEAYVIAGPLSRMRLYGTQFVGQQAILAYQRDEDQLPSVGEVYALSTENAQGVVTAQQYVRVIGVAHELRTFTDTNGDFSRRVLTLSLTDKLTQTFLGAEPVRASSDPSATKLRVTQVADTTQYFGTVALAEDVSLGDLTIKASSVYARLVPSATSEAAISLARVQGATGLVPASSGTVTESPFGTGLIKSGYTNRPILPGSVGLTTGGLSAGDDGNGALSGTMVDSAHPATVDYASGLVQFTSVSPIAPSITYTPAAAPVQAAHTHRTDITLANRGSVYAYTVKPLPQPGTLSVSYMALGKWYVLTDTGAGNLVGADPSFGTGSVQYASGGVVVTLGALPDIGSALLLSWGSRAHYEQRAGVAIGNVVSIKRTLTHRPLLASSLTISWLAGGVTVTATTSGTGVITGPGVTGAVDPTTGDVVLNFSTLPDAGAVFDFAYSQAGPTNGTDTVLSETTAPWGGTSISAGVALTPGTITLSLDIGYGRVICKDDGAGNLIVPAQKVTNETVTVQGSPLTGGRYSIVGAVNVDQQIIGTVTYATGTVTLTSGVQVVRNEYEPVFQRTIS